MPPAPTYAFGTMTLLGDAAHASTSHGGAGAGMAVEDAFILSELLSDIRVISKDDISMVLSVYDLVRRPRTQRQVTHSRQNGQLYSLSLPGYKDDISKVKEVLAARQRWIWDIDLKGHLAEAKKELKEAFETRSF